MILVSKTYWAGPPFEFREPPARARVESVALRADDHRRFRALYWTPEQGPPPKVAVIAMHPRVDFTHHYSFVRLLDAGVGCLGANTRNPNNDMTTEHEEIVLDLAGCVRWLKKKRGVETVILLGNSGGGSLAAYFQSQARAAPEARVRTSPGGAPARLAGAELVPADALLLVAAHRGQGAVLGGCIDASVTDESNPLAVDPELDMYDPANGFREPPQWTEYSEAFLARYRLAQRARVARLDAAARVMLAASSDAAAESELPGFDARPFSERRAVLTRRCLEPVMVIYRTMANPAYVDRRIDPSPRGYGSLLSDRPDLMNMQSLGLARVCTPRAWLSTWSALSSRADLVANIAAVPDPTLVVHAGADREIYPQDAKAIFEAAAAADKTLAVIEGAGHYFEPPLGDKRSPHTEELMDVVVSWIRARYAI